MYCRDPEAFWAAAIAPLLADRGSVVTWLKQLEVDVGLLSAFRGLDHEAQGVLQEYSAAFGLDVAQWKSN